MPKRLLYLLYYLKNLDLRAFRRAVTHVSERYPITRTRLYVRALYESLVYNISPLEYFQFGFFRLSDEKKRHYAGTGYMYEYQRFMNPPANRRVLADKLAFHQTFSGLVKRGHSSLNQLLSRPQSAMEALQNPTGKVVLKPARGQCGTNIEVVALRDMDARTLGSRMRANGHDLAEAYVRQHSSMMGLSPSGLNTVRLVTELDERSTVRILTARLRISVDSAVDNLAAGNLAASVDIDTGRVNGAAVYSDIARPPVRTHPITRRRIPGFAIPHWDAVIQLAREAALLVPELRSIGWDIAITPAGPDLIEGNHNWCKLLWQLPAGRGLKHHLLPLA